MNIDSTSAYARSSDPQTSHEAAESVRPTELESTVLEALRTFPAGATSYQIAAALGLSLVTVSPRLRPLVCKGLVVDSGHRARGPSGRSQTVWQARKVTP